MPHSFKRSETYTLDEDVFGLKALLSPSVGTGASPAKPAKDAGKLVPINEMTRKEILGGADAARTKRSKSEKITVHYQGVTPKRGWIKFLVSSQHTPGLKYTVYIVLNEAGDMKYFKEFKPREVIRLFLSGNLKVSCSCPDFQYRYKYMTYHMGYGLYKEMRFPHIANPDLTGSACKHVLAVLRYLINNQFMIERDMLKSPYFQKRFTDTEDPKKGRKPTGRKRR